MMDALTIQRLLPVTRKTVKAKPDAAAYRKWLEQNEAKLAALLKRQAGCQHHMTFWTRKQNDFALRIGRLQKRVTYLRKQLTPKQEA